jgi:hypothetical protein
MNYKIRGYEMKKIMRLTALFSLLVNFILIAQISAKVFYVKKSPPAKKITIVKTVPQHSNAIWIEGHWSWTGEKYIWWKGYWVKHRKNYIWVSGKWVKQPKGWMWVAGYWKLIT